MESLILAPVSYTHLEVAGRMAIINGAFYLQKTKGGKGKLLPMYSNNELNPICA